MSAPQQKTVAFSDGPLVVCAQKQARILRLLPKVLDGEGLGHLDTDDMGGVVVGLGERVYDVLEVLVPDGLPPRWKYHGFASAGAMDADDYDPAHDQSPTLPQTIAVFHAAYEVNGLAALSEQLGKLLGVELAEAIRQLVAAQISQLMASQTSASWPPASGESTPVSSGTKVPDDRVTLQV